MIGDETVYKRGFKNKNIAYIVTSLRSDKQRTNTDHFDSTGKASNLCFGHWRHRLCRQVVHGFAQLLQERSRTVPPMKAALLLIR
jgi:hypothetical protein